MNLKRETFLYYLKLTYKYSKTNVLKFIVIEKITSNPGYVSVNFAYPLFPHVPPGSLDRPGWELCWDQVLAFIDNNIHNSIFINGFTTIVAIIVNAIVDLFKLSPQQLAHQSQILMLTAKIKQR